MQNNTPSLGVLKPVNPTSLNIPQTNMQGGQPENMNPPKGSGVPAPEISPEILAVITTMKRSFEQSVRATMETFKNEIKEEISGVAEKVSALENSQTLLKRDVEVIKDNTATNDNRIELLVDIIDRQDHMLTECKDRLDRLELNSTNNEIRI